MRCVCLSLAPFVFVSLLWWSVLYARVVKKRNLTVRVSQWSVHCHINGVRVVEGGYKQVEYVLGTTGDIILNVQDERVRIDCSSDRV